MLHNWLIPEKHFAEKKGNKLNAQVKFYSKKTPDLNGVKTALIGLDNTSDLIRKHLYSYSGFPDNSDRAIADLGNIRKRNQEFIIPLINELLQGGILPVLLSEDAELLTAQFNSYKILKQKVNLTVIDEKVRLSLNGSNREYINTILEEQEVDQLLQLSVIGAQGHLTDNDVLTYFDMKHFDVIRLGNVRSSIEENEPIIRDADMVAIHLSALKNIEAPAQFSGSPSGLFVEEACRLSRYAGMSDKLSSIGFYGYDLKKDVGQQTAQVIAQMIWYFWDGFLSRKFDYPVSVDGLVEYIVDSKIHNYHLVFWQSSKSGRWWMQIPMQFKSEVQKHALVPCSYKDYQLACQGDLPERLINAFQRML
ncbi:MAG: hypothetical protein ACOYOA_02375 [Saprospiraceae bacterium]